MAELKGGTTIAGYTALHSGLQEAYLNGNLTMGGKITIPKGGEIWSEKNNNFFIKEHGNGSITLSAAGGQLFLGYQNTQIVRLSANLVGTDGSTLIADTAAKLYYQGQDTDVRYVRMASDPYVSADLSGSSAYPRLVVKNSGASTPDWIRMPSTSTGLLPYSNGNSSIGTSTWRFKDIHAVNFYENGTALSSKYASSGHNHDSTYVNRSGDSYSGTHNLTNATLRWDKNSDYAVLSYVDYSSSDNSQLTLDVGDRHTDWFRIRGANSSGALQNVADFSYSGNDFYVQLNMHNNNIASINSLYGQYGLILRSTDEWLRVNDTGDVHSSGVYFGSSVVRTDGEFQLGSSGSTVRMTSSGITLNGTFNFDNTNSKMTVEGEEILSFLPNNYGRGVLFGGNQSTYIIAGDGATRWSKANGNDNETVYLASDNNVKVTTNLNDGTTGPVWEFKANGDLIFPQENAVYYDDYGNIRQNKGGAQWKVYGSDGGSNLLVELGANGMTEVNNIRIRATGDLSETGTSHGLQIGPNSGSRLAMDTNEIMSLNGSNYDGLYITASDLQWDQGGGGVKLARIRYGTGGPPSSNAYNGDIYVQY